MIKLLECFARIGFSFKTRRKSARKRSLHAVNEHFELIFNAVLKEKTFVQGTPLKKC